MKAEILSIGTELLIGHVVNTNATYLSEELNAIGIGVYYHTAVGDNPERIQEVLALAAKRSDLVICTGGLGPTADDISNDVIAEFFGQELYEDPEQAKIIEKKFCKSKKQIPKINYRQARVTKEATVIPNPIGTAIGLQFEVPREEIPGYESFVAEERCSSKKLIVATLPGVPVEMKAMYKESILQFLARRLAEQLREAAIVSKKIRLLGITESQMAQTIKDYAEQTGKEFFDSENPSLAPYATLGECYLRMTAKAETEHAARNIMQPMQLEIENILGEYIFGFDEDTIQSVLSRRLIDRELTISFAESCTGGLLSKLMTDIPGSSAYTTLNLVTYSNQAKQDLLGVSAETLGNYGAVSSECALEMARGLRARTGSAINVAVTGIAGPDGGTEDKPVGLVYMGFAFGDAALGEDFAEELDLEARESLTREQIRVLTAKKLLYKVFKLLDLSPSTQ